MENCLEFTKCTNLGSTWTSWLTLVHLGMQIEFERLDMAKLLKHLYYYDLPLPR